MTTIFRPLPANFADRIMTSYSTNWFTLLLLCTSTPLIFCSDQFDRGSRQVKREPFDLATLLANFTISTCLTHTEPKSWPLTLSSITTKRFIVDWSNYTFLNHYNKSILLVWLLTTLRQFVFEFHPYTIYFMTSRLPVQEVTRQKCKILVFGFVPT